MATFVLSYRLPAGYTRTPESTAAWMAWFDSMGDNLVDIGRPVLDRTAVGNCGGGTNLGGYSLITADDLAAAAVLAKGCPVLDRDGGVEIGLLGPAVDRPSTGQPG